MQTPLQGGYAHRQPLAAGDEVVPALCMDGFEIAPSQEFTQILAAAGGFRREQYPSGEAFEEGQELRRRFLGAALDAQGRWGLRGEIQGPGLRALEALEF